ncbi:hypothetical protein ACFLTG_03490 [Chloroflexota bacterium]
MDNIANVLGVTQTTMGYKERTRIERSLFLVMESFCKDYLEYELGGLSAEHKILFSDAVRKADWPGRYVQLVDKAFEIYRNIVQISSTDPYVRSDIENELDTDVRGALGVIGGKLKSLVDTIRKEL